MEEGPCLKHCYRCSPMVRILATVALVYVVASLYYIMATRHMDTPFHDSLTEEQRAIKKQSAARRGGIFQMGLLLGGIGVMFTSPFQRA